MAYEGIEILSSISAFYQKDKAKGVDQAVILYRNKYLAASDRVYYYIDLCEINLSSNLKINLGTYYKINNYKKP